MFNKIKEYWDEWILKIQQSDNTPLELQISMLTDKNFDLQSKLLKTKTLLNDVQNEYNETRIVLKSLEPIEVNKPVWLNGTPRYKPKRRIVSKTKDVTVTFKDARHVFSKSVMLHDEMKKANFLNKELSYQLMYNIYKWITRRISYELDKTDNWRPVEDTLLSGFGDCDDSGGVAITSALGMAGWKNDEIFCCVGYYYPKGKSKEPKNRFYHSWCIVFVSECWWVLEGTSADAKPERLNNVKDKYVIDDAWNWKFSGKVNIKKLLEETKNG